MLTESDVINAVCDYLRSLECSVSCHRCETEQGDDIEAVSPAGQTILIEAKGETSSQKHTKRFGKVFTSNQVLDHVAKAVYRACDCASRGNVLAGVAFPKNKHHESRVEKIQPALKKLQIEVFWVCVETKQVSVMGNWDLILHDR
ncbi:MAG TPA: hypothetical protein VGH19_14090 [Verrucomicrobiae bacterium]